MVISHYGMGYIKAQLGDTVLAFNPIGKDFDSKATKFGADIALISLLNNPAFNGKDNVTFGTKVPFTIEGPGEYEIGGNIIRGFKSDGPDGSINTIYTVTIDGIRICHLGGLATPTIDPLVVEQIGATDILFLPIGGDKYLSAKDAAKLAANLEPKIVVPIVYDAASLKLFLKESGEEKENSVDKLSIKKKDLEDKEGEIIIIKS